MRSFLSFSMGSVVCKTVHMNGKTSSGRRRDDKRSHIEILDEMQKQAARDKKAKERKMLIGNHSKSKVAVESSSSCEYKEELNCSWCEGREDRKLEVIDEGKPCEVVPIAWSKESHINLLDDNDSPIMEGNKKSHEAPRSDWDMNKTTVAADIERCAFTTQVQPFGDVIEEEEGAEQQENHILPSLAGDRINKNSSILLNRAFRQTTETFSIESVRSDVVELGSLNANQSGDDSICTVCDEYVTNSPPDQDAHNNNANKHVQRSVCRYLSSMPYVLSCIASFELFKLEYVS